MSSDVVTLTVEIEPIMVSRTFDSVKLFARGASSGLSTGLSIKTLSMVVTGPQLVMNGLRGADIVAYVDVTGLEAGTYELPVQLHAEGVDMTGMTFVATPSTVTVTIN